MKNPTVNLSHYERAVNMLNNLQPGQERVMSAAMNDLIRQRHAAEAMAEALAVRVDRMAALLGEARELLSSQHDSGDCAAMIRRIDEETGVSV
jgi:hypothetical protein